MTKQFLQQISPTEIICVLLQSKAAEVSFLVLLPYSVEYIILSVYAGILVVDFLPQPKTVRHSSLKSDPRLSILLKVYSK